MADIEAGKSRTGCKACKERKVKCDEEKPVCRKCRVHFTNVTECDYGQAHEQDAASPSDSDSQRANRVLVPPPRPQPKLLSKNPVVVPPRSVSPSMLDPFSSHPPCEEPDIDMLMETYFAYQVFNILPYYPTRRSNPIIEYYVPLIWKDSVLFHVTLLLSAYQLEKGTTSQEQLRTRRLARRCLSLLQDRVNSSGPECVADETLSAIAGIAAVEHEKGNSRLVQMHMDGLRRILDLRGGFRAIRRSNATVANVVWCIFVATADDSFPETDLEGPVERPPWFYSAMEKDSADPRIDFAAHGVAPQHADLMWNIRMLAKTYQTAQDCSDAREYQDVMTFLTSTLQRLLSLPYPTAPRTYEESITAACRHAMVVHVFALWCDHQPDPSLMVSLAQHNLLMTLQPLMRHGTSNKLVLWLCAVGATGRFGQAERKWFVSQLANIAADLGIRSWSDMKASLKEVIWHEYQDEVQHRELWEEVDRQAESDEDA